MFRYELRMRIVRTASAVVVAACVVVLTVRVLFFGLPLVVEGQKVYDKQELTSRVLDALSGRLPGGVSDLTCPSGVTIKAGVTFHCTLTSDGGKKQVPVTVTDTDSGEFEVGDF